MMSGVIVKKPTEKELAEMKARTWPIWEKEASRFEWSYDDKETCYIIEGKVTVTAKDGKTAEFGAGDLVIFPKGLECVWEIHKAVRKHYKFGA